MTDKTPELIALERIEEANQLQAISLDLSKLGLTAIPTEIAKLTNLKSVNVGLNKISNLPDELFELRNLEELYLGGFHRDNQANDEDVFHESHISSHEKRRNEIFEQLWAEENLRPLGGRVQVAPKGNLLSALNPKINNLKMLKRLDVSSNELKFLTSEIFDLENLEEFDFSYNDTRTIPKQIGKLTKLKYIDGIGNNLRSLPNEFCDLKNLKVAIL